MTAVDLPISCCHLCDVGAAGVVCGCVVCGCGGKPHCRDWGGSLSHCRFCFCPSSLPLLLKTAAAAKSQAGVLVGVGVSFILKMAES